jgi:hypothetical protein
MLFYSQITDTLIIEQEDFLYHTGISNIHIT